jgi:hypothetical protein
MKLPGTPEQESNMNQRIVKKLSKKLASIVGDRFGEVWIDHEVEPWPIHWAHAQDKPLTKKQVRQNIESESSRINHIVSIGGELDYWGEGTDYFTLFEYMSDMFCESQLCYCDVCLSPPFDKCEVSKSKKHIKASAINVLYFARNL